MTDPKCSYLGKCNSRRCPVHGGKPVEPARVETRTEVRWDIQAPVDKEWIPLKSGFLSEHGAHDWLHWWREDQQDNGPARIVRRTVTTATEVVAEWGERGEGE